MRAPINTRDRLVRICFYWLLPGFFIYHTLVGKEFLPGLLGGYSTAMSAILLLPMSFAYAQHLLESREHRLPLDTVYAGFVFYYASVLAVQFAIGARGNAVADQFGIIFQFLTLFMLARLAPLGDPNFQRWLLAFLVLMTAIIAFNADEGTFAVAALDLQGFNENLANYQAFAFVYSVVMLYVVAPMQQRWQRVLVYLFGIPTLFLNGARTEFIGILLLFSTIEFLDSKHKAITLLVTSSMLAIGIASLPLLADLYPESRTVLLFLDYSDDVSANERAQMLRDGWRSIAGSPWIGSFQSHARGEHIHNALSAWVDLGLLGFIVFVVLIAVPAVDLFLLQRLSFRNPTYRLAFSLVFLTALFAITAKHYTHQLFPLALGIYARHLIEQRRAPPGPPQAITPATLSV
ncbi:O-antigen ligase family protein [Paucibacter soli]|uniref:O-antigen ligase family protein n=1 Tax=Paucibacter soli TaxID=3133433 RepID=UPI00309B4B79